MIPFNLFTLIFTLLLTLPLFSEAQEAGEKSTPKNYVSLKIGADDPWIGITYERVWISHIGTEIQLGIIGASAGIKLYYPGMGKKKVNFYIGAMPAWGFAGGAKTYFPIGINVMTKNYLRISLDAGPRIWHNKYDDNLFGASIKIGSGF